MTWIAQLGNNLIAAGANISSKYKEKIYHKGFNGNPNYIFAHDKLRFIQSKGI